MFHIGKLSTSSIKEKAETPSLGVEPPSLDEGDTSLEIEERLEHEENIEDTNDVVKTKNKGTKRFFRYTALHLC